MRVSATITAPRVEKNIYSQARKIKFYGKGNDYPQKVLDIIGSSGTGKVCVGIYSKFIEGAGFADAVLNTAVLNRRGERAAMLLHKCANDLRTFDGFALLVKYNGALLVDEIYSIPFEHCRLEIDSKKDYTGRIAVHPDWTQESGKPFRNDDIRYIDKFNPATVLTEMQAAGGPLKYLGQVYYCTANGDIEYPVCPFDAIITDMLTEESVSTVKHRNAKFNFLPSGILVRKGIKPPTLSDGTTDASSQISSAEEIKQMQGDANAAKIWIVDVDADEEKPEFIPFDAKNYDKQYEYTESTVQENIARMSMIPPILRGVDVGAGFGATLMTEAYNFMNSITDSERTIIQDAFKSAMQNYKQTFTNFTIAPLRYNTMP